MLNYQSAMEHAQQIAAGAITSEALTQSYLDRIQGLNPKLHALVEVFDQALDVAKERDQQLDSGQSLGPLHGVPVTVKECFMMKGSRTTNNFPPMKDYVADSDSILVQRLKEAGAVILGKTNVPILLADSQTFGPLYPTANNPFDLSRTPGGSTGGGASAVAAGLTTFELGSDIGGSIRNPSHYCGLFGLKPTVNGHALDGHVPPMPGNDIGFAAMNCTGPLARSMADIKLAYQVCFAPDWPRQAYLPVARPHPQVDSQAGYRIGYFDHILTINAGTETKQVLQQTLKRLQGAGYEVERVNIPDSLMRDILRTWAKLYGFVLGQEFSWPMRQLLKLKFAPDLRGSQLALKADMFAGLGLDFKVFTAALKQQQQLTQHFCELFDKHDFLLSPTSVGPAFPHNPKHKPIDVDGHMMHYGDYCFSFVLPYNLTGLPVLTFPAGQTEQGLPIGLSLAGPHHTESALIDFGERLEALGFGFTPPNL